MSAEPSPSFLALQGALAGRYALERELGRGGMGVVYLARDLSLDRPVAVKLLPPALASVPALRERFLREARTAARLSHPHIVPIHSVEEHGEFVLFVMGYVEGETLGERVARQGPLPPEESARILQEVAWALAYAHQRGVVHRDIKPDNILIERGTGRAVVTDFGIAQVGKPAPGKGGREIIGTARYMSPEQLAGGPLDGRSDLYSLGVTALQLLAPAMPERLAPIVTRCIEAEPADRFPDAEALAEALDQVRGRQMPVPRPVERFIDLYKTLGVEVSTYAAILIVLGAETVAMMNRDFGLFLIILIYASFIGVGLGVLRTMQLIGNARSLLTQGYTVGDVRSALERQDEARAEGGLGPVTVGVRRPSRVRRWLLGLGGVAGAGVWVAAWSWWNLASRGMVVDGLLFAILTLVPVVMLRTAVARMMRPGRRGWWSRVWWKVMEWKVFKVARLGGGPAAVGPNEPTEVALGAGAQSLFEALPVELRTRFAEVPAALQRLEAQARRLRESLAARDSARLASTLAAMEQIRLDLLRLRAGDGAGGELTGDLDAARRVAERVEALLDVQREIGG